MQARAVAVAGCGGRNLLHDATEVVPGAGPGHSALLLVGEQPGAQEDRESRTIEEIIGPPTDAGEEDAAHGFGTRRRGTSWP